MKLLVVLVNYNTTALLSKCLDTLARQQIDGDYRVVVVDNHSSDGGAEDIAAKCTCDALQFDPQHGGGQDVFDALVRQIDRLDPSYKN